MMIFFKNARYLLLTGLLLLGCSFSKNNPDLSTFIEKAVVSRQAFTLTDFTKNDWDTLLIFTPYSDPKELNSRFPDSDFFPIEKTNISMNDGICVLAFLQKGELVEFTKYQRIKGDFSTLAVDSDFGIPVFPKEKCVFEAYEGEDQNINGGQWIEIRQGK